MTRETKIGLLVGLAFIIVIGILLSDHMATTTEPTQAALDTAAQHARGAIVVPNENLGGATIPQQITPREIAPSNPIPTRNDVTRPPVVTEISIGTPTPGGTPVAPRGASVTPQPTQPAGQSTVVVHEPTQPAGQTETATSVTPAPPAGVDPGLIETARSVGEELVVTGQRDQQAPARETAAQVRETRPAVTQKTYVVEAGDTLGRIASKTMGANSRANRDAIVKANPSMNGNPDKVVIGQTLVIPTPAAASASASATSAQTATAVLPLRPVAPSRDNGNTITYVVKPGDNLSAIAREKLGSVREIGTIKAMNKDVLNGGDVLRVGMRLKLPAKPVASAN